MARATVPLREPIPWVDGLIKEIVLRSPNLVEYGRIGEPYEVVTPKKGEPVYIEYEQEIAGYLECCVIEPKDPNALAHVRARRRDGGEAGAARFFYRGESGKGAAELADQLCRNRVDILVRGTHAMGGPEFAYIAQQVSAKGGWKRPRTCAFLK